MRDGSVVEIIGVNASYRFIYDDVGEAEMVLEKLYEGMRRVPDAEPLKICIREATEEEMP